MLAASVALFCCGLVIAALRFPPPFLVLAGAVVAVAYAGHAVLSGYASPLTLLEVFTLLTALQAGYLVGSAVETAVSNFQLMPTRLLRSAKLFAAALALATGAFVLTMLKDPPQSVAFDPAWTLPPTTNVHVPAGLPPGRNE